MNCKAFRTHFEIPHTSLNFGTDSADVARHLANCAECSRFVEGQRELSASLELLRDSVPELGASFDVTVLANYHRQISGRGSRQPISPRRSFAIAYLSIAAAALSIMAALLLYPRHKPIWTVAKSQDTPAIPSNPVLAKTYPAKSSGEGVPRASALKVVPKRTSRKLTSPQRPSIASAVTTLAQEEDPGPAPFRGLVYCDPLSCSGPMQMIRVQLPVFPDGLLPGRAAAKDGGVVYADVIVGSDGIARGIRVLK